MADVKYPIWGKYQGGETEEVDSADNKKEAKRLLGEYRLAFGQGWSLWIGKARKTHDTD